MKNLIAMLLLFLVLCAAMPFAWSLRQRSFDSRRPRLHVITDMDKQQRLQTQTQHSFFLDQRAMRPKVVGTIAREDPAVDDHWLLGLQGNEWATGFPMPLNQEIMQRGRLFFGIYCTPCHGVSGHGSGMISVRAVELNEGTWTLPTSLHDEAVRVQPVGQLFNTVSRGVRNMPGYGHQMTVENRWAIVAYVRALQRSQNASAMDVPPQSRDELMAGLEGPQP